MAQNQWNAQWKEVEAMVDQVLQDQARQDLIIDRVGTAVRNALVAGFYDLFRAAVDEAVLKIPKVDVGMELRLAIEKRVEAHAKEHFDNMHSWEIRAQLKEVVEQKAPELMAAALERFDAVALLRADLERRAKEYLTAQVSDIIRTELGMIATELAQQRGELRELRQLLDSANARAYQIEQRLEVKR